MVDFYLSPVTCTSCLECSHFLTSCFRMSYPYRYELYKRVNDPSGKEKYVILSTYPQKPTIDEVNNAFEGKPR